MKSRKVLFVLFVAVVLLFSSCDLLKSDIFQEAKEVNLFKEFEDNPFLTSEELLAYLEPYGSITDECVTFPSVPDTTGYRNVFTMTTVFNSSAAIVIESFTIVPDLNEYLEKVNSMIANDTLFEYEMSGGSIGALSVNVDRIREKVASLKVTVNNVGFITETVGTQVNTELDTIISFAEAILSDLTGEV